MGEIGEVETILKIWATDRPGVLDRIAGLIRRKGWNISSMTAGDIDEGISQINLSITGRDVDAAVLGEHLDELDGVHSWEECRPGTHIIREMILFRVHREKHHLPEDADLRIVGKEGPLLFAEYTGTPAEVDSLLKVMRGQMVSCVRTGPLVLAAEEREEQ